MSHRAAMNHLGEPGADPEPAPVLGPMPRSVGPAARVIVSAGDMARFARTHLKNGTAPGGARVLSPRAVAAMQHREVDGRPGSPPGRPSAADAAPDRAALASRHDRGCAVGRR
ncbi:hypothetical protein AB0H37_30745 [Actinomadura sp. NPDC023710]|uniref:hypothetical protein n=1 Tax=Actinomadura sp. NPDC023710 TaxID=3158219 RepID=UPI0033C0AE8D